MLRLYLRQYDALEDAINEIDEQVDAAIAKMDAERSSAGTARRKRSAPWPLRW
jgi:hypothetical protein